MFCKEPFLPSEAHKNNPAVDPQPTYQDISLAFLQQPCQQVQPSRPPGTDEGAWTQGCTPAMLRSIGFTRHRPPLS